MPSSLSNLVHRRFAFLSFLLFVALGLNLWFIRINFATWSLWWIFSSILHGLAVFFSLAISASWNLQRVSFRLRSGALIKIVFWLTGLFTVFSGIITYLTVIEQKNLFWPLIGLFAANLISLIFGMTVRYAIEEDVKTRKVCEFC